MSYDINYCCISSMQHIEYGAPFHEHDPDCINHPDNVTAREYAETEGQATLDALRAALDATRGT